MHRSALEVKSWTASATEWICKAPGAPYFVTESGKPWTPIGQNDAITWPEFASLYRRRSTREAEEYVAMLAEHGVTCLRLMLEYSQTGYRYFERKDGSFNPHLVQLWDDIFDLCRLYGLKVLLTPFDTFWMWKKWKHHPYNRVHGGPCASRSQWCLCSETRARIKRRLTFATERWGSDGTIFGWDLWNEIHPAHANNSADGLWEFVEDVGNHLRRTEERLHGQAHLQTVSIFHPVMESDQRLSDIVHGHPCLDMVNIHMYEDGTIDCPENTVDAAISTGKLIARAIEQAGPDRPVFDTEHGPIHTFKDHHRTLSDDFDTEYFRHIQWAHLASGGAGGGMRWPNRHPHSLTAGMRKAQQNLAGFLRYIDWSGFRRRSHTGSLEITHPDVAAFGCADGRQAVVYLLREDDLTRSGTARRDGSLVSATVRLPQMQPGAYTITAWDTVRGLREQMSHAHFSGDAMTVSSPPFEADLALAITRRG